jgi:hypothetical protein
MEREMAGISTISAMAANASHATNLCCAARFNTRKTLNDCKPELGSRHNDTNRRKIHALGRSILTIAGRTDG